MEGLIYYEKPHRFLDERGFFQELFNGYRMWKQTRPLGSSTIPEAMGQVNHSHSKKGVLRGMHWQMPNPIGKYVTCVQGCILDVVVDIRKSSPTFKKWKSFEIDAEVGQALWVPEGFAHGFVVTSPSADVIYMQSGAFDAGADRSLRWDDPEIAIEWPSDNDSLPIISEKDKTAPLLSELPEEVLFD